MAVGLAEMATALHEQRRTPDLATLSSEERLAAPGAAKSELRQVPSDCGYQDQRRRISRSRERWSGTDALLRVAPDRNEAYRGSGHDRETACASALSFFCPFRLCAVKILPPCYGPAGNQILEIQDRPNQAISEGDFRNPPQAFRCLRNVRLSLLRIVWR